MDSPPPEALISGGGSGVGGAASARAFAARGWSVAVNYRTRSGEAEEVAAACRKEGVDAITVARDVADNTPACASSEKPCGA